MSLSHHKAQAYLQAAADGLLADEALAELHSHLEECSVCQAYAAELAQLEAQLARSLQARWPNPTHTQREIRRVAARVQARIGKRSWLRQISDAAQGVAWVGLIVAMVIAVGWIFKTVTPQLATLPGEPSARATATKTPTPLPKPTATIAPIVEGVTPAADTNRDGEQTLTICMGSEPDSLYLYGTATLAARQVHEAIYDGPIDTNSFSYQPVILESLPTVADGDAIVGAVTVKAGDQIVNDSGRPVVLAQGVSVRPAGCYSSDCAVAFDGTPLEMEQMTVTFTLKAGIRWSDGEPLTAFDSVYSFELNQDPDTPSDKFTVERTARYEALDDTTTVWRGLPGYRDSTYLDNFWTPLPAHAWDELTALELLEEPESTRKPLGWGAYVIQEWIPGEHISLAKNENYWRADEGLPRFETVVYRFVGENASANVAALLSGECDIVDQTSNLNSQSEMLLELQAVGKLNATFGTGTVWEHIDFGINPSEDYERPNFFADVRVRRAMAYCMDRQAVVDTALFGQSQVLHTYLPTDHPLYNPDIRQYRFDPQAGARLLESVGWVDDDDNPETPRVAQGVEGVPDGTALAFSYWTTSAAQRQAATAILQTSLAECGVQADLEYWSPGEFFADGPQGPIFGRRFDLGQFAWLTGVEPPCELYLSSQTPTPGNGWTGSNNTGFADQDYDAACQGALQSLLGTSENEQFHREAQRILAEQLPVIPLYLRLSVAATRPDMQGFSMDATARSEFWNIEAFDHRE